MKALALVAALCCSCAPLFGPAERQQVIDDQKKIDSCEELARACARDGGAPEGCFAVYDRCLTDGGLQ